MCDKLAQKYFSVIKDFKKDDLLDFLRKNGHGEYEEILINGEVTDGEKFLGLNELEITHWRLPQPLKKKLWSFLTEIKTDPKKFIVQFDTKVKSTTNVKSFSHTNTNITEKLAPVIGSNPVKRKAAPTPNSKEPEPQSENDLASENNGKPSGNVSTEVNLEKHPVQNSKYGKKPLPLPPNTLLNDDYDLEPHVGCSNNYLFNLNDEPFYRNTDRKGARLLLLDLEDGAFLFRPSEHFFLTLTLKYNNKYINLGIEKTENNSIRFNPEGRDSSPEFPTLGAFVAYFTTNLLTFRYQGKVVEIYLQKHLPEDRY